MSSLPLRELREEDAPAVAALFTAAFGDDRPMDAEEIRSWLRNEELQRDRLRVLEVDGRIVGYGDVWVEDDVVQLDVAAPGHWEPFLEWAEGFGKDTRLYVPAGHELAAVGAARGYRYWRSSFQMEIELRDRPAAEAPLDLRSYTAADEQLLVSALNEAFGEDPSWHHVGPANFRSFYLESRGFDPALWLLAWDGDDLAGFSLAYPERVGEPGLGWIGTLGVRKPWRRRGLGEALLLASFAALHDRGLRRVGLGVDAENVTGALRLYERVGMRKVRQSDNWVKPA